MNVEPRLMTQARATSGRQAIEQSLLDWRHEASRATSISAAAAVHARSALAIARVLTCAALADTARVVRSGAGLWLSAWLVAPLVMNHWMLSSDPRAWAMGLRADYLMVVTGAPSMAMLAIATAHRRIEMPILGVVVFTCALQAAVASFGWSVVWSAMMRDDAAWWLSVLKGSATAKVSVVAVLSGLPILGLAALIGGRIRNDHRRWVLAVTIGSLWLVVPPSLHALALRIAPTPLECSVQHVFLEAYRPAMAALVTSRWTWLAAIVGVWFWLMRRQERAGAAL